MGVEQPGVEQLGVQPAPKPMTDDSVRHGVFVRNAAVTFEHAAMSCAVSIEQRPDSDVPLEADGTCRRLWPTSIVLARFLCDHPALVRGKRVIELGAGTGCAGVTCAALGASQVVLTDMPEAVPLLSDNVTRNAALTGRMQAAPCTWGDEEHLGALLRTQPNGFDVVLAVEVVYKQHADVLRALAASMARLATQEGALLLMAYEFRGELFDDLEFFDAANELFECETVPLTPWEASQSYADEEDDVRYLYIYSRKGDADANAAAAALHAKAAEQRT